MESASNLNKLYLVVKHLLVLLQIIPNVVMAVVAEAILVYISVMKLPSLDKVTPIYLRLPFMVMSELMLFVLTITFLFYVLTSMA